MKTLNKLINIWANNIEEIFFFKKKRNEARELVKREIECIE